MSFGTGLFNILYLIGIVLISYDIYQLKELRHNRNEPFDSIQVSRSDHSPHRRIAWIDGQGVDPLNQHMRHVREVFEMMGYQIVSGAQNNTFDWDVMWIHEYTLHNEKYKKHIQNSKPHQLINHVPGSGYYTSKVSLATSGLTDGVPKAFQLPKEKEEFLKFAENNPDYLWVQKDNNHRNIKIHEVADMDLTKENSFVQRFVENPLLIDNRKFDIGIYTVVTSLQPLRVYIYDGDALLRFCPADYNPFDATNVDKYVVGDDYTPIWEIPSLNHYYNEQKLSMRATLDAYLLSKGIDSSIIWKQIEKTIAEVFQRRQANMLVAQKSNPFPARFFELSRFDFVVDENMKVYIMEANMSPNLSSGHFTQNQVLYEQVLMSVLSLVGLANPIEKPAEIYLRNLQPRENPIVKDRDIRVLKEECYNGKCTDCANLLDGYIGKTGPQYTVKQKECQLCGHCLSTSSSKHLSQAYLENLNRRKMKRVKLDFENVKPLTQEDEVLNQWLTFKCKEDLAWC